MNHEKELPMMAALFALGVIDTDLCEPRLSRGH
jgi:hypothetical protein